MIQKEITINGKTYPVAFNMRAIMNYEDLSQGKSFFGETFTQMKPRLALIMATVLAANEDADLTVEELLKGDTWEEVQAIINAYNIIMELVGEFFKIPKVEEINEVDVKPEDEEKDEEGKNAKN